MSFPRYPAYKDSGVEWLGEVPEHWNRTALKFLADYQNGYPFKPDERGETGLPIIRISQLTGDDEPAYYSGTLDERVKVRNGDLLFSWSATIDSYIWNKGEAWLNQHIFRVSPSKEADKRYLYYAIKHVAPKLADFDAHGSTMRHIKKESLGEKIYVPSVFDQGQIATFLDRETAKIDALIAEQQRLIELLQEKRQAVISHAVTKGLNPDAPMKDSGVEWLGEVPEHWVISRLRHLGSLQNGLNIGGEAFGSGYPFISYGDAYKNRYLPTEPAGLVESSSEDRKKYDIQRGDVLFTRTSESIDDIAIASTAIEHIPNAAFAGFLIRFRPKGGLLAPEFSSFLFRNKSLQEHFSGTLNIVTRASLSQSDLGDLPLALPPIGEQVAIASRVTWENNRLLDMLNASGDAITLLQERRSALISAAVTGQIDVRGLVPEASAA